MQKLRKKNIVAVLAGVAVAAAVTASAATLGGLTTQHLGANSNDVAGQIDNGLTVTWDTSYDASKKYYVVDDFTVQTTDATEELPEGAEIKLTLVLTDGDPAEFVGTIGEDGAVELDTTGLSVPAHGVVGASVVVIGGGDTAGDIDRP